MRCFISICKADLKRGFYVCRKFYALLFFVAFLGSVSSYSKLYKHIIDGTVKSVSLGEGIISFFKGTKEYIKGNMVNIPEISLVIVFILLIIISLYINNDIQGIGKNILVNSCSYSKWWLSKFIWMIISVTFFYMIILFANILSGVLLFGENFNISFSYICESNVKIFFNTSEICETINSFSFIGESFLLFVTAASVQLLISLLLRPAYGIIIEIIVFTFSVFNMRWYWVFNYMMSLRIECMPNGFENEVYGIYFMLGINAVVVLTGILRLKNREFV